VPAVAKARPIPGLSGKEPYAAAAARVVAVRAQELVDNSAGVLDVDDIERVHDMRVATRRLRAALEVFAPCFPSDEHASALKEVKALADALGERRDRDVTISALRDFAAGLSVADRPGVESLIGQIRAEQMEANAALAPYVEPERLGGVRERLGEMVREAERAAGAEPGVAAEAASLAAASEGNGGGAIESSNGADAEGPA
jgi:CHAD domain-containing protein